MYQNQETHDYHQRDVGGINSQLNPLDMSNLNNTQKNNSNNAVGVIGSMVRTGSNNSHGSNNSNGRIILGNSNSPRGEIRRHLSSSYEDNDATNNNISNVNNTNPERSHSLSAQTDAPSSDGGGFRGSIHSLHSANSIDSMQIDVTIIDPLYEKEPCYDIRISNSISQWNVLRSHSELTQLHRELLACSSVTSSPNSHHRDLSGVELPVGLSSTGNKFNNFPTTEPDFLNTDNTKKEISDICGGVEEYFRAILTSSDKINETCVIEFFEANRFALSSFLHVGSLVRCVNLLESNLVDNTNQMRIMMQNLIDINAAYGKLCVRLNDMDTSLSHTRSQVSALPSNFAMANANINISNPTNTSVTTLADSLSRNSVGGQTMQLQQSQTLDVVIRTEQNSTSGDTTSPRIDYNDSPSPSSSQSGVKADNIQSTASRVWNYALPVNDTPSYEQNIEQNSCDLLSEVHFWGSGLSRSVRSNRDPSYVDMEVDKVLEMIWPTNSQILFRNGLNELVLKIIKNSTGLRGVTLGLYNLKVFLPHEPSYITIANITGQKDQVETWLRQIAARLHTLNEGSTEDVDKDSSIMVRHSVVDIVLNVDIDGKGENQLVLEFKLDGIKFHISFDNHSDLAYLPLVEYISTRIDKDHLMKRSILIIKAWWQYCSLASKRNSNHNLSDLEESILVTMICAIFNKYHDKIFQPFQALCVFILEYNAFDWNSHIISIFGNFRISPGETELISGMSPRFNQVISLESLESCMKWYYVSKYGSISNNNTNNSENTLGGSNAGKNDQSSPEISPRLNVSDSQENHHNITPIPENGPCDDSQDSKININDYRSISSFQFGYLHVIHSTSFTDNCAAHLSAETVTRIRESFRHGSNDLQLILQLSEPAAAVKTFLQEISHRFELGNKPDVGNHDTSREVNMRCKFDDVNVDRLFDEISYANMAQSGELSERGFKMLFRELLEERGALPVGEIGKMLQECSGFGTITSVLKASYGGLKKFLEGCKDEILIGRNHPFNPHVYLKKYLTSDDVQVILDGDIPAGYMSKFKKWKGPSKKSKFNNNNSNNNNNNNHAHKNNKKNHNSNNNHNNNNNVNSNDAVTNNIGLSTNFNSIYSSHFDRNNSMVTNNIGNGVNASVGLSGGSNPGNRRPNYQQQVQSLLSSRGRASYHESLPGQQASSLSQARRNSHPPQTGLNRLELSWDKESVYNDMDHDFLPNVDLSTFF